jgi:hypothetical protein
VPAQAQPSRGLSSLASPTTDYLNALGVATASRPRGCAPALVFIHRRSCCRPLLVARHPSGCHRPSAPKRTPKTNRGADGWEGGRAAVEVHCVHGTHAHTHTHKTLALTQPLPPIYLNHHNRNSPRIRRPASTCALARKKGSLDTPTYARSPERRCHIVIVLPPPYLALHARVPASCTALHHVCVHPLFQPLPPPAHAPRLIKHQDTFAVFDCVCSTLACASLVLYLHHGPKDKPASVMPARHGDS